MNEQEAIEKMTNWQRHQWAKAGYPCERDGQEGAPQRYATLPYGEIMKEEKDERDLPEGDFAR